MAKVFLGVGHGGDDPGAVGYLREEDVNLNMALACREYLVANGVEVQMSRTTDENDDLNEECRECNAYNPDLAVDIHNNAGGGDGFEAFYSISGEGKTLAQHLEAEVKALGQNSRGCKTKKGKNGDYYGFIRSTKCKSVIVEGVFVDNANDVKIADTLEEQKAFGVAYAKGILKELGIEAKPVEATKPTQNPSSVDNGYLVKINTKVLNVRSGAGTVNRINTTVKMGEVYTIVEEKMNGSTKWGKLKSGAGWISLKYTVPFNNSSTTVQVAQKTTEYYPIPNYKGNSIVSALNTIGVDSSFDYRKKIAQKNNVRDYIGTAQQNNQLLSKLKAGRLIKA